MESYALLLVIAVCVILVKGDSHKPPGGDVDYVTFEGPVGPIDCHTCAEIVLKFALSIHNVYYVSTTFTVKSSIFEDGKLVASNSFDVNVFTTPEVYTPLITLVHRNVPYVTPGIRKYTATIEVLKHDNCKLAAFPLKLPLGVTLPLMLDVFAVGCTQCPDGMPLSPQTGDVRTVDVTTTLTATTIPIKVQMPFKYVLKVVMKAINPEDKPMTVTFSARLQDNFQGHSISFKEETVAIPSKCSGMFMRQYELDRVFPTLRTVRKVVFYSTFFYQFDPNARRRTKKQDTRVFRYSTYAGGWV